MIKRRWRTLRPSTDLNPSQQLIFIVISSLTHHLINKTNGHRYLRGATGRKYIHCRLFLNRQQLQNYRFFHQELQQLSKKYVWLHVELNDIDKAQKASAHDLSNFKMSTSNTFSTMNEVLDSRGSISKGNNKSIEEGLE
jgi:hypothetical protein